MKPSHLQRASASPGRHGRWGKGKGLRTGLGAGADAALALLVVGVVALMIVPLPTWLLDILLAANLSGAVLVLLVVLYAPDALSVAAFPTLLLLTTLVRLGLNVSSSRLILLQADAGEVIRAFGQFVVRGNYVVGAVVFVVLTVIQFVVIAKGSERVAEVGARFVLDALPGKQMAIDAELRSGTLDGAEARRRRAVLTRESQFYGAMDGAMKFVKGDVIASIVIALVNILAGLAIGVGQRGMEVEVALKRYGLLTIGDGLVSQIPALILSTAAGILVTRTAAEDSGTGEARSSLGQELARQIAREPRALLVAAMFVAALAAVPGLPTVPFLILAVALAFGGLRRRRDAEGAPSRASAALPSLVPVVVPWSVTLGEGAARRLVTLPAAVEALPSRLFAGLGLPLPHGVVTVDSALPGGRVVVALHEVPALTRDLPPLGADGNEGADDAFVGAWAEEVEALLKRRAHELLGLTETQRLLDALEATAPATVRNVVPKPVTLPLLADVLRRLLDEQVSIRDLKGILDALAVFAAGEKDPLNLAELVRQQLRRALTFRATAGAPELPVLLLDPMVEDTFRRAVTRTAVGTYLALPPQPAREILAATQRALAAASPSGAAESTPVVLTAPDIRRYVRKLLEAELPDVTVLSFAELMPEVRLVPRGHVDLRDIR